ncbi:MAG TPA: zinc ribbon domain-containing protein [Defluviitaleaceae bacterium]|jgi:hypothetical protein|nr:zinc ribbon domain-containing protein [Candidatus Epulonipiscium sp.]HOA79920.1 zinc ribbon domain-containing protein [Defluviitaleaceae bacterium]
MFFIGIFGIQTKEKEISSVRNTICPSCEALGSYKIIKTYNYFHIFFIPIFKWNINYYIRTSCCRKVYMIDSQLGKEIEQGKIETLKKEDLIVLNDIIDKDRCLNCGSAINDHYAYCPYCGKPLV